MIAQRLTGSQGQKKEEQTPSSQNSRTLAIFMAGFSALASIATLFGGIFLNFWPLYLVSAAFAISFITNIFVISPIWNASFGIKIFTATLAIELSFVLAGGAISLTYGLPFAFVAIVFAFLFAAFNPTGRLNEWIIGAGLIGALSCVLLGVLTPFPQINNLIASIIILALDLVALVVLIRLLISGLITANLRLKLILFALALAIVPLIILAVINLRAVQNSVTAQSNDTLRVATEVTVNQMDDFFSSNLTSLENEASLPIFLAYLNIAPTLRENSEEWVELSSTLASFQTKGTLYTPSFGILDLTGENIYDTNQNNIGKSESSSDYFQNCMTTNTAYASTVEFIPNTHESYIYFIAPILASNQTAVGYLRMTYDSRIIQAELEKYSGLIGAHSYPMILDENGIRLADASNPDLIYHSIQSLGGDKYTSLVTTGKIPSYIPETQITSPIDEIANAIYVAQSKPYQFFNVDMQSTNTGILDSATFAIMSTQKWYVVYLQEQTAIVAAQKSLTQTTALIALLIAGIVSIIITIVSNLFTEPIIDLTETAAAIANGDLDTYVNVTSSDEIGTLGKTFNSMALQLKSSFENLENRVRERTQELATQNDTLRYRSRQLQTVTDVAREIVSTNDVESLLNSVTELISDRFNFYHAGIFLIDEQNEYAVLRASSSPGGKRMLNRQHKLKVGQVGIVGYVTGSGSPRIATDVGKDAVFFNNPDLPETKSEMALPLKIENRIIGALDIQSTESNAFSEENVRLFTTLADLVSVAINNNQLLANTQAALTEAQNLHRQYLNQEWTRRSSDIGRTSYKYTAQGLSTYEEDLPEVKMVFESGRPVTRSGVQDSSNKITFSTLAVPILLRGEVIGVIHLQENEETNSVWSENELLTVQTLADQLAQTLESARLFEQTIRRADRERRILEITSRIRSTNDPQQMLEITLEELKRHLGASQAQIVINVPGPLSTIESKDNNDSKEA
jgi:GAF domain-containing protein/HAMP domain-containing protein